MPQTTSFLDHAEPDSAARRPRAAKAERRPSITCLQLARGLERLEEEMAQGTYQPARTPDRHLLAAQDIFRWLGK